MIKLGNATIPELFREFGKNMDVLNFTRKEIALRKFGEIEQKVSHRMLIDLLAAKEKEVAQIEFIIKQHNQDKLSDRLKEIERKLESGKRFAFNDFYDMVVHFHSLARLPVGFHKKIGDFFYRLYQQAKKGVYMEERFH